MEEVLTLTGLLIKEENLINEKEPGVLIDMEDEELKLNEIDGISIENEALELLVERIKSIK